MKLLVSIHDVTPAMQDEVEVLWELCVSKGIVPALFVVPNWHGIWPLGDFSRFAARLRMFRMKGSAIALHGERHDELGSVRGIRESLRAWGRTAGEGEFLCLDYSEAGERLRRGVAVLRNIGLEPAGFVPPAWLDNAETRRATRDAGFRYTEDAATVTLFSRGTRMRSPVFRWSSRTRGRAWGSSVLMRLKCVTEADSWLIRIALHPQDLRAASTRLALEDSLDHWGSRRFQWHYSRL